MRETRLSGSEGGGANSIDSPYPYRSIVAAERIEEPEPRRPNLA
jgi:hypothetical protein